MRSKRKLPPHIVLPNGQWRFIKRGSKRKSYSKKVYRKTRRVMARRRRSYGGRRGGFGGGFKPMLAPILAGVADAVINPRLPINGVGSTAVGFVMHNEFAKNVGLYQIGQSAAAFIPFIGASAGGITSQV